MIYVGKVGELVLPRAFCLHIFRSLFLQRCKNTFVLQINLHKGQTCKQRAEASFEEHRVHIFRSC
jgi:hypothetical protein